MRPFNTILPVVALIALTVLAGCEQDQIHEDRGTLKLVFDMTYDGADLDLEQDATLNGENIRITRFKFYAGDIRLGGDQLSDVELISFNEGSTERTYSLPMGTYSGLDLAIGVPFDLNNANPATYGADHPLSTSNNMHWPMGNYIFTKIEGFYQDTLPFLYHVGLDTFYTELSSSIDVPISPGATTTVTVSMDLYDVFAGQAQTIDPVTEFDTHTMNDMPLAAKVISNLAASTTIE